VLRFGEAALAVGKARETDLLARVWSGREGPATGLELESRGEVVPGMSMESEEKDRVLFLGVGVKDRESTSADGATMEVAMLAVALGISSRELSRDMSGGRGGTKESVEVRDRARRNGVAHALALALELESEDEELLKEPETRETRCSDIIGRRQECARAKGTAGRAHRARQVEARQRAVRGTARRASARESTVVPDDR
jgi:hypothetical protein